MSNQTVNFLRTLNRWRRGGETLEQPSPRVVGEMIDAACDEIEQLTRQRDEARKWAEAAWAKCDRAEKMLRIAAAKADEAQSDYERVCRVLAGKGAQ